MLSTTFFQAYVILECLRQRVDSVVYVANFANQRYIRCIGLRRWVRSLYLWIYAWYADFAFLLAFWATFILVLEEVRRSHQWFAVSCFLCPMQSRPPVD